MQLPSVLQEKIEDLIKNISLDELKKQIQSVSLQYRTGGTRGIAPLSSDRQRLAYVLARMPATFAALVHVLNECRQRAPDLQIESFLDVGTGPGTALWALDAVFPSGLTMVTLLERDASFISLGKQLASVQEWGIKKLEWIVCDAVKEDRFDLHDLTLASFSLGEMQELDWKRTLLAMWQATRKILIVVEPGTPQGFERVRRMRDLLIEQKAYLIAPCPHSQACPMQGADWCHFSARVERSSMHRQMKDAQLNYEDEKFSYLIFSREPIPPVQRRILSQPQKKSGYVNLKLCTAKGLELVTISRKSQDEYRKARKADWGDSL